MSQKQYNSFNETVNFIEYFMKKFVSMREIEANILPSLNLISPKDVNEELIKLAVKCNPLLKPSSNLFKT